MLGSSRVAVQLAASQEGLSSMSEWVSESFVRILTTIYSAPSGYTNTAIHLLEINTKILVCKWTYSAWNSSFYLIPLLSGFHLTPHVVPYKANITFSFLFSWYSQHWQWGKSWVNSFFDIAYETVYPLSNVVRIIKSNRTKWKACNRRWRNEKYVQKFCPESQLMKPIETHRHRWEDTAEASLWQHILQGTEWIHPPQYRSQMAGLCEHGNELSPPFLAG
jgi:hypothetical protein